MKLLIICYILALSGSSISADFTQNEKYRTALWSLRCLYAGFDTCEHLLSGSDFKEDVKFENLENIFDEQSKLVRAAYVYHNFTSLQENELCSISTPLLLLIPIDQLARLDGELLGKLLACRSYDLSVVQQIAFAARRSNSSDAFYRLLQSVHLPEPSLRILGRSITHVNNTTSLQIFLSERDSILEYLPPIVIAKEPSKMLSYVRNVNSESWSLKPADVKRVWAFFVVNAEYPTTILLWDDKTLEKWGHLLIGATGDELRSLQESNIRNKTVFLDQDFSVAQVRYIFDDFYGKSNLTTFSAINTFKRHFPSLLPRHVQRFHAEAVNFKIIEGWQRISSLATARQIVEYVVKSESNTTLEPFLAREENILKLKTLTYSLPLRFFSILKSTFSLDDLIKIQHEKMTTTQIFYLTNRGIAFDGNSNVFPKVTHLLRGLPTSFLFHSKTTAYDNLLISLPASLPTRTAALLQLLGPRLVQQNVLRVLVQNPDFKKYLDFLPSRFFTFHGEELINSLLRMSTVDDTADRIPDLVLSSLLAKYHKGPITWKIIDSRNGSTKQDFLLHGITCQDINAMDPLDFMFIISRYNQRRKSVGKPYPEDLQICCIIKLQEYLKMKSSFAPFFVDQNLLVLLTPADIQSLGGFILAGLPVAEIHMASHRNLIVQTIGSLTLPELMAAAPMDKLLRITELFVTEGVGLDLFDLGNLTHFLSVHSINEIKGPAFKLLLESGLFDKRICATDAQRSAWAYLIISGFGNPEDWTAQDLITLGDMLFVMPYTEMERITDEAWTEAADVIAGSTRYVEEIHWPQPRTPFYQACRTALKDTYEADHYVRELSQYVGWLLSAAQRQIKTVVPARLVASIEQSFPSESARSSSTIPPVKEKEQFSGWWRRLFTVGLKRNRRESSLAFDLTCDAIRMVGKSSELFLNLGIIEKIADGELRDCLDELAQMDLNDNLTTHIWRRMVMKDIFLTGKLAAAIDVKDLIMLNVTKISMTSNWGLELVSTLSRYNSRNDTASYVMNQLEGIKGNEVTFEQLVALGPLACHLFKLDSVITASVFLKASRYLGSILPCDHQCLGSFMYLIDRENAYGPVTNWTSEDIESMGIFVSALSNDKWSSLINNNPKSLSRLGITALKCLDGKHVHAMTSEAVHVLPLSTARYLKEFQSIHLNDTVRTTLSNNLDPQSHLFNLETTVLDNSSPYLKRQSIFPILFIIPISYFLMFYL